MQSKIVFMIIFFFYEIEDFFKTVIFKNVISVKLFAINRLYVT